MPTGTCDWVSPGNGVSLTRVVELKYDISDSVGDMSGFAIYANGILVTASPTVILGNEQEGTLYFLWDTRAHSNGAVTLRAVAVGSDDIEVEDSITVTVANTHASGVLYRDYRIGAVLDPEREYHRAHLQLWAGPVPDGLVGRYWLKVALYTDDSIAVIDEETDPAVAQTAFEAMQLLEMGEYKDLNGNGKVYTLPNGVTLMTPGQDLFARVQMTPLVSQLSWETGSAEVYKIRRISEGNYAVFCRDNDQLFTYDGKDLTAVVDLTAVYAIGAVSDMCVLDDKLYYSLSGTLYAYDMDSDDPDSAKVIILSPAFEDRPCVWLEAVGSSIIALFVDPLSAGDITQAYAIAGDQTDQIWSLDLEPDVVWTDGTHLYLGCGAKLYRSSAGTGTPTLLNAVDFQADIASIGPGSVGLADGSMWVYVGTDWVEYVDEAFPQVVQAIEVWFGTLESYHYLFGAQDDTMREQAEDGSFGETIVLTPPEGGTAVDQVLAMCRYTIGVTLSESEGYVLPDEERLLIGTGDDGLFFDVQVSRLDLAAALPICILNDVVGTGSHRSVLV